MQFTLEISLDNDEPANDHPDTLARYLREVADKVQAGYGNGNVRDINGNTIGQFAITGEH